ncbi:MAG: alpha-hydroxy acid oxidase [Armatimonadota bacterium]
MPLETPFPESIPVSVRDFLEGGAEDETTLRANRRAWRAIPIPGSLPEGPGRTPASFRILDAPAPAPLLLAPCALARLAHPGGESAVARAAASVGIPMVVSTTASETLEETAAAAPDLDRWFQLYAVPDRTIVADLISRAERAGYRALVLTVDTPVLGRRERDLRGGWALPHGIRLANLERYGAGLDGYAAQRKDPGLTWDIVHWIRAQTQLPLALKGILAGGDAARAVELGVEAVIVSNHGGRQLDGVPATAEALPEIVDAVGGRAAVLVDGGIRSGLDVLRARLLGADAVLIGRPWLRALAAGGETRLAAELQEWIAEIRLAEARFGAPCQPSPA